MPCSSLYVFVIEFEVNLSFCSELGSAEPSLSNLIDLPPNMTKFVLPGSAEPSILCDSKLHGVQRVHLTHYPMDGTAVWGCTGEAHSHQAFKTPAQSHSLCQWSYVRCGLATAMPPAVRGASTHLPLVLPPLLGSPTLTPCATVACNPSTACFFCNREAAAAAVASLPSSSFLFRWAHSSSFAFFSFSFSSFFRCRSRASSCFRNSR